MSTTAEKLNLLLNTKADIKAALIEKGQEDVGDVFSTYPNKIRAIKTGVELPELTNPAAEGHVLSGYEFIDEAGSKKTGNIASKSASNLSANGKTVTVPAGYYPNQVTKDVATATQAIPSISVDSAGKITAAATQSAGYVSAGTKSATKQLTTQAAKTVTPGTTDQTAIAAGTYATGAVTVTGDANLVAGNIVEGKTIFGKTGTAEPASALADELTTQDDLISQIMTALEGKAAGGGGNYLDANTEVF